MKLEEVLLLPELCIPYAYYHNAMPGTYYTAEKKVAFF